jgi:UDP-perosamine 4-acetyltransferase
VKDVRMKERVVIIGAGPHGRVVADIVSLNPNQELVGYTDPKKKEVEGVKVLGNDDFLDKKDKYDTAIICLGGVHAKIRHKIYSKLKEKGVKFATTIHPNAVIAKDVEVGDGTAIMAGAVVNPGTKIGENCVVNTNASVDHDNVLGNSVFIQPGAITGGTVKVGDASVIGIGATVLEEKTIGTNSIVGGGAVVTKDVPDNVVVTGVPAVKISDN